MNRDKLHIVLTREILYDAMLLKIPEYIFPHWTFEFRPLFSVFHANIVQVYVQLT